MEQIRCIHLYVLLFNNGYWLSRLIAITYIVNKSDVVFSQLE